MMTVRKEQNQGIHSGSYEQSNDNEEDDDDEDGHFIISLEDNGEEEGLLCDPEDISFSSADKQTDVSSYVNKAMREEPTTSRLTYPSVLGASHVQSKRDDPEHLIYTFPTSTVLKNQIDMKNSETEKYSRSQLSSTWVEPESSSIPASSSNNNGCGPRDSMQLISTMASVSCLPSSQAWEPDRTSKNLQINDDESNKSKSNFDSNSWGLNSQSVPICNQNGLTKKKSSVSNNVSSCDIGLETIKLGVESGGIWSEAIFLSKSHNGPHGPYPFCYSNKNSSVVGPSVSDTNINIQSNCSSGQTILTSSLTISSPPALSALKPSDSLSFSSSTLSSQSASCAPRLSGPYLRTDLTEGTSSRHHGTGGVPESNLPTAHTDNIKHEESVDSAGCSCIMCYKTCAPSAPDSRNLDLEIGGVGVKVGTNNKRKRALDSQKARKKKEGPKFVDIYVLPEKANAINVNGSGGSDWQSKMLGSNCLSEPTHFLPSPMINSCINSASPALPLNTVTSTSSLVHTRTQPSSASPALPLNTVTSTSSLVHTRTQPSSQGTSRGMCHVSASSHILLNAQKQSQEKKLIGLQSVNRPIAPRVLVSLSEVQGKDETSGTAYPLCSVTTQNIGSCITSNKSVSPMEKTFATSSLASLRSQNFKYLQTEPEPNSLKKLEGICVTSTTEQSSPLYAHQPGAVHLSNTSVKVNPALVSDTEKTKGSYTVEGPAVIVLKDPSQFKILNNLLKQHKSGIIGNNSALLPEYHTQKTAVSNNNIKSPQITVLKEPPKESIYAKSLLSPNVSTSIISKNFTMHYHTASSNSTSLLQSSAPPASVAASIPHATQPQCAFISSFQRQSCVGNKNLVYSLLKDNFQKPGLTKNSQMVSPSNKLAPEKETSQLDHDLRIVKAEDSGTPSYEDESFGSNTPTPHPPQERLPKSYIEDWVNQAKTYTLNEESRTQGSGSNWGKSKPIDEEVTSVHNYTKTTSSPELQSNLTTEVNADAGTRTTLVLPMAPTLKPTPQTPTSLGLTLTSRNISEVSASHSFPSAGALKPDKLYSAVKHTDSIMANNLLSSSASKECLQESNNLSPTKVAKPMAVNRCLTGGRSILLSQSKKRITVFKSAPQSRRTTSSSVVTSSNGIKLKIRFDAFEKKSQNSLDPQIGKVAESASVTFVSENEHLNKDKLRTIKDSEITSSSPAVTPAEPFGNERVETAEEMFQRFQKQAMQEVFKAQSGVGNLSRNLRPVRTSLAFLDKSLWRSNLEHPKKKKREEEKSSNLTPKTDDTCSTTSAFSKDSGDKRLLEGNKKRHMSEGESVSVKQARLSSKDYPKLKEDSSITKQKKVICSNILAGHRVFVKFNTYSNIHTGRCFLVPFFNIGGTRTQFDVEDMEYISKAVVDYEKEEKSCARHLLFHAREGQKASFLRKENYHHSSKITEKNYKKCSFLLEGFQRHAIKPSAPVVERWTVEKALDIEIDKADVDPDEEAYFASMLDETSKSHSVTAFQLVTTEEAISKSQENNNSGIEIDIAEVDDNAEEEFASQMACSATQNIDNDGMAHVQTEPQSEISDSGDGFLKPSHPHSLKTNRREILNSGNGFSRSSHPLILKRNRAVIHSVLKGTVSTTHQVLPYSNSNSESISSSTNEQEITKAVLSPNTFSPSEDRGIRSEVEEANSSCAPNQNSAVIKREVSNPDYGDVSTFDPAPSSPVSVLVPCVHRVKDEPIDEYFDSLPTLVIKRQDPSGMPSTNDMVNSLGPTNLLEPQPSTNQLVSCPTLTESTAAVSPGLPSISSQSDNNFKDKSSTDISDKPNTETVKCARNKESVVDDSVSSLNNRCVSVSVLVTDGVGGDQHEGMTTPTRKIINETVSPVVTESTLTADESPPPSPSISESSEVSSYSDIEDPVVDELGQMDAMSHGQCLSPDKQNPIQSKITSLVESLRQRLTQQTPSLPPWLGTDAVPRVRSKIKIRSKDKSKSSTLCSTKNIETLSIEPPTVACDESTQLLHSPHTFSSPTIDNIHNPGAQSMLVESTPPVSTLLPHSGPSLNESFHPHSSSQPHVAQQDPETLSPNAVSSATRQGSVNKSNEDVSTEAMPLPVISSGQTKTLSHCESPAGHQCLPSVEVESFSKVQPLTTLPASSSCEAQNGKLSFPQTSTFSVVHPTHASSNYALPQCLGYFPQTSSSNIPILPHGENNTGDENCMNNAQQTSLPCPPVPDLTIDSNRSTPSDFEIDVGADIFEDDVKFQPIQPKLRKLSWKDFAAPYSRLVSTNLSDSPPMSPWGLLSEGLSTSALLYPSQQKSSSDQPGFTHQRSKIVRQNYSKRGKKIKSFMKGKKSAEKKAVLPAIPSALDEFIPTETAESVTSYLTKKFSSTPGSKIKGPRLLHDPSKKKATPQKAESDTSLAPAAPILPGPISTAELSKTPSLSEIFGIEIKKNVSSANLATDSQVEVRGSSSEDFLQVSKRKTSQVAKKRTSQMAKKKTAQVAKKKTSLVVKEKRSQVARKRTSGKKKKLDAGHTFNSKRVSRGVETVSKTGGNGTLEATASETVFKSLSPDSQVTSSNLELRQPAPCDMKNEFIPSLDDTKLSGGHVLIAKTALSNIPTCTVTLHRLEDMNQSYELRDGIYFVKGTKSKNIRDNKVKESSDIISASQKVARKIIKRKKKRSRVTRKQPVIRPKKDIVDYYTSMLESLQKKAQQLEEESRKEKEEKERKEMEERSKKECVEKTKEELGKTDGGNANDNSGIETALSEIYDNIINEDLEEDELKNLLEPTDAGHLLTEKTSTGSEATSMGLGLVTGSEQVQDMDSGKSDLTSQVLVENNSDNNEENMSVPANKKPLQGPEAGENVGHGDRTDCVPQETNVEEGYKDYICGKDPLDKGSVFEKKDIVLCSSYDEEMLKMSSCESQKMAAEEDALLGQAEDFEGDDIGVIPQIEVERLLGLDTNATSPDTLDDFNLELKDQISIMEQLKDGDLIEAEMADVLQKQSGLKNEGRFLFGDSPGVKKSLSSEPKKDIAKTSDPSQSFESALRWVNIPEPIESTSHQDTVSSVDNKTMDAQLKQSEAQNNFKVQLKFQTASLIKSIKLSKEMKNVFGEAASGGNSPTEDKKETFVLSKSENADKSQENNCTVAATSAPEMPLTNSPKSKLPIPKLRVKLRREAIEAIGKAKANFVSNKRAEKKPVNGSEGKFIRNSDNSEVQLQEDMQFYLRSSNSRVTPPRSPVKCQGQLSHSNQKSKRGFSPRRASPRFDLRATRSKCLSTNSSSLKMAGLEVLKEHSNVESKQSTSKISEGIFSSVHLFDESQESSVASDTNTGSKPSQSVNASDTAKPSLSLKPSVKPLTIDILKLKMKLNPLFSTKAKQNGSKTPETESKSPPGESKSPPVESKETVSVCPESHPSMTTSLVESNTNQNQKDMVHSAGVSRLEVVPSHAAFPNTSPQVVLKKLPTLNTAKLCNILKTFQKKTNNKTAQETCRPDSASTALSNANAVLCSSLVTKRSSTRSTRLQKSAVGASRVGRALRSSAKNVQVSLTNLVGVESKNVVETIKQPDPTGNLSVNPNKQFKEADDKERSFFDCLTDVTNPGDWVDM